ASTMAKARTPCRLAHAGTPSSLGLAGGDLGHEDRAHLAAAARQVHAPDERAQVASGRQLFATGELHDDRARPKGDRDRVVFVRSGERFVIESAEQRKKAFVS